MYGRLRADDARTHRLDDGGGASVSEAWKAKATRFMIHVKSGSAKEGPWFDPLRPLLWRSPPGLEWSPLQARRGMGSA
jgi:hypothetical protein